VFCASKRTARRREYEAATPNFETTYYKKIIAKTKNFEGKIKYNTLR